MLILTRKKGQAIVVGDDMEIVITAIEGDQVKIGINALPNIKIYRKELIEAVQASNKEAIASPNVINQFKQITDINKN